MIRLEHLTQEEKDRIGDELAEAFSLETGVFPYVYTEEQIRKMFRVVADLYSEAGYLYTTSEKREGYCIYYTKKTKPGAGFNMRYLIRVIRDIDYRSMSRLSAVYADWEDYESQYRHEPDYVDVFMVCVTKEYRGKGYLRKIMAEPFALARERNLPCILDTDSAVKAAKYQAVGMRIVKEKQVNDTIRMYTMEYR